MPFPRLAAPHGTPSTRSNDRATSAACLRRPNIVRWRTSGNIWEVGHALPLRPAHYGGLDTRQAPLHVTVANGATSMLPTDTRPRHVDASQLPPPGDKCAGYDRLGISAEVATKAMPTTIRMQSSRAECSAIPCACCHRHAYGALAPNRRRMTRTPTTPRRDTPAMRRCGQVLKRVDARAMPIRRSSISASAPTGALGSTRYATQSRVLAHVACHAAPVSPHRHCRSIANATLRKLSSTTSGPNAYRMADQSSKPLLAMDAERTATDAARCLNRPPRSCIRRIRDCSYSSLCNIRQMAVISVSGNLLHKGRE